MYIEADGVTHGDSARLLSAHCDYRGPLCLQFWYHMHGSATAMALNIYQLGATKAEKIWSIANDQGPEWRQASVDIKVVDSFQVTQCRGPQTFCQAPALVKTSHPLPLLQNVILSLASHLLAHSLQYPCASEAPLPLWKILTQ